MLNQPKRLVNWKDYNNALKNRGSLTVWLDKDTLASWYVPTQHTRGAQMKYSNLAIEVMFTIGKVFHQRLRQTEGLMSSIVQLLGLHLDVPDYSTLSRRLAKVNVDLNLLDKDNVVLVADSTGMKFYGEGEWKVRRYGHSKHRTWLKLHIAMDIDNEIRVCALTGNDIADCDECVSMLKKETAKIDAFVADGCYDIKKVYNELESLGVRDIRVPPRKNAKILQHGNIRKKPHPRDENLRQIRLEGRKNWKRRVGYHVRSKVESTMYRIKTIFTDRVHMRREDNQKVEFEIMCSVLNRMNQLGMPMYSDI